MSGPQIPVLGTFDSPNTVGAPPVASVATTSNTSSEPSGPSAEQLLKEAQDMYDKLLLLGIMKIDAQNKLAKQKELLTILREITAPSPSQG